MDEHTRYSREPITRHCPHLAGSWFIHLCRVRAIRNPSHCPLGTKHTCRSIGRSDHTSVTAALVSWMTSSRTKPRDAGEDLIGGFGPHEGRWGLVSDCEVVSEVASRGRTLRWAPPLICRWDRYIASAAEISPRSSDIERHFASLTGHRTPTAACCVAVRYSETSRESQRERADHRISTGLVCGWFWGLDLAI